MKFAAAYARFLDRWAGPAACLAASLFPRVFRGRAGAPASRVLVMKFWEGGLIAMGAPWFRSLRRAFPGARIDFLTLDVNAELCRMTVAADRVLPLRISRGLAVFLLDLLRLLPALRAARYGLVLDLEFLSRFSAALTGLIGPARAAGFSSPGVYRGGVHSDRVPFVPARHMTENYDALFAAVGAAPSEADRGPLASSSAGLEVLEGAGPFIVLNFDRKDIMPERAWPRENYEAVLGAVLAGGRYSAVAISQKRVELPDRPRFHNLSGLLDYPSLAGLFARAALFITHDSGPLHIAAAMGCPTVSVFGPESPAGYAPRGPRHRALFLGLPCSPCIDALKGKDLRCVRRGNECVTGVTPEMVLAAAKELLGEL